MGPIAWNMARCLVCAHPDKIDHCALDAAGRTLFFRNDDGTNWQKLKIRSSETVELLKAAIAFRLGLTERLITLTVHRFDPKTNEIGKDALDSTNSIAEALPSAAEDYCVVVRSMRSGSAGD